MTLELAAYEALALSFLICVIDQIIRISSDGAQIVCKVPVKLEHLREREGEKCF